MSAILWRCSIFVGVFQVCWVMSSGSKVTETSVAEPWFTVGDFNELRHFAAFEAELENIRDRKDNTGRDFSYLYNLFSKLVQEVNRYGSEFKSDAASTRKQIQKVEQYLSELRSRREALSPPFCHHELLALSETIVCVRLTKTFFQEVTERNGDVWLFGDNIEDDDSAPLVREIARSFEVARQATRHALPRPRADV